MAKTERLREELSNPPSPDYVKQRAAAGWRLAAVEWVREAPAGTGDTDDLAHEVPYGLKIADDCMHLEADPLEREALLIMLESIVQDKPLSQVAADLNGRGIHTRQGGEWTPATVFNMLPRMIEVGPRVFAQDEWAARRRRLFRAV